MKQFMYCFQDFPAVGVLRAESYEAALEALQKEFQSEEDVGSVYVQEIFEDGYNENGIQPKIFGYCEVIEDGLDQSNA